MMNADVAAIIRRELMGSEIVEGKKINQVHFSMKFFDSYSNGELFSQPGTKI